MDIIENATTYAGDWEESKHPRVPSGTAAGGQFTSGARVPEPAATPKPAGPNAFKPDNKTGWAAVPKDQQEMVRRNWAEDYMHRNINRPDVKHMDTAAQRDHLYREGKDMFDNRLDDEAKLNHFRRMDPDEFRGADQPRSDETGPLVREQRANRWFEEHPNQVPRANPDDPDEMAAHQVGQPDASKPLAPGLPTSELGKEPRVGMPGGGTTPDQQDEARRLQDFRAGRGEAPSSADLQRWRDRGWIAPDAVFEPVNPTEPEQEPFSTGAEPQAEEDSGPTPEPEEWGELNGRQQERVYEKWKEDTHDAFVEDNINQWREDDYNFQDVPEELSKDQEWNEQAIKDINNGYYPGERPAGIDDSGGGTPAAHDEEDQRVREWKAHFDVDASFQNGAFVTDNESGKLEVDPDKLVFRDNPHEGPDAERQQLIPGVTREEMSSAYKKAEWAKVKDDFEEQYNQKFEAEAADRVEKMKENPPEHLYDVDEYQSEAWDNMDDREKWKHAKNFLSDLHGDGGDESSGGSRGEGQAGTVGPSEEDAPEQKKIQKLQPVSKKNLGGGVSESKIVTMKDGSKFVWKPSTGEANVRDGIDAGVQYQREVAAYDIAKTVGMKNLMPVSTIMKYEGNYGVMMQMIPHAHNDGSEGDAEFENTALKGTIFDFVIGNTDRHGANWMSDDDGKLWLIDHGLSFSTGGDSVRFGLWSSAVHNVNSDEAIDAALIKPWKGKWDKIEAILQRRGIEKRAIENAHERYDILMEKGVTWRHLFDNGE